jgi:hypothetical protein
MNSIEDVGSIPVEVPVRYRLAARALLASRHIGDAPMVLVTPLAR